MGHRFQSSNATTSCGRCGLGADHSHHATVAEETAKANEEAAKAEAEYTEVQAERDLAFIHLRTLYRALDSSGGDILSDEVLESALGQIVRLRANVRVLEDANASFVGGMRGAPKVADASTGHLAERAALCPNGSAIVDECIALAAMLIEKNIAYGDSALSPLRVFAKGIDAKSQILVRLDDKLSRLARGSAAGEDVILDLLGYLILYRVAEKKS